MAIKPQISLGQTSTRKFVANRKFTDRKEPRQAFSNQIQQIMEENLSNSSEYHVLVYYGIGGIGKSSLQNYLQKYLRENFEKCYYSYLDFSNVSLRHPNKAFLEMINNMHCTYKFSFPHFWVAYAIYFKKLNPEIVYQDKKLLKSENWNILADLLALMEGTGLISVVPGIVNKVYDIFKNWGLDRRLSVDLKNLESLDVCSIEEKLPAFWAYDLNKNFQKFHTSPAVIFLDTYEALWSDTRNERTKYSTDAWIREMISHLKGVLFVICGREHLVWENVDKDWKDVLDQHLLDRLSSNDSEDFLVQCGIEEEDIRKKMLKVSTGYPYHLDLLVDTYSEIRNSGLEPTIDMFASNKRQILECFLRYLSTEEIAVIKVMSIVRFYDFKLFQLLLEKFPTGYSITLFEQFNKFSFVNKLSSEQYYIHDIMRREILQYIDNILAQNVHKATCDFYMDGYKNTTNFIHKKLCFREVIYHAMHFQTQREFTDFLNTVCMQMFEMLQVRGDTNYLKEILLEIYACFNENISLHLLNILIDMLQLNGQYYEAVRISENKLSKIDYKELSINTEFAKMYIRCIHNKMTYTNPRDLSQSLKIFMNMMPKNIMTELYVETLFTTATLELASGNYVNCVILLNAAYDLAEKQSFLLLQCRILRKFTEYYMGQNDFVNAYKSCKRGIDLCTQNHFERYLLYLQCDMAEWYRKKNMLGKAQKLYEYCKSKFESKGIRSWVGHVTIGMALIEHDRQNFERGIEFLIIAKQIYKSVNHEWGLMQVEIIQAECQYCCNQSLSIEQLTEQINKARIMDYTRERYALEQLIEKNNFSWTLLFL
jgi:hypothetical protein